jgi:hypothetical protein
LPNGCGTRWAVTSYVYPTKTQSTMPPSAPAYSWRRPPPLHYSGWYSTSVQLPCTTQLTPSRMGWKRRKKSNSRPGQSLLLPRLFPNPPPTTSKTRTMTRTGTMTRTRTLVRTRTMVMATTTTTTPPTPVPFPIPITRIPPALALALVSRQKGEKGETRGREWGESMPTGQATPNGSTSAIEI